MQFVGLPARGVLDLSIEIVGLRCSSVPVIPDWEVLLFVITGSAGCLVVLCCKETRIEATLIGVGTSAVRHTDHKLLLPKVLSAVRYTDHRFKIFLE